MEEFEDILNEQNEKELQNMLKEIINKNDKESKRLIKNKRISSALKGKKKTREHVKHLKEAKRGKPIHTEDSKRIISEKNKKKLLMSKKYKNLQKTHKKNILRPTKVF